MNNPNYIHDALRRLRKEAGYTQQQAAEMAGLAQSHLSMIENGKRGIPAMLAKELFELYGVKITSKIAETNNTSERLTMATSVLSVLAKSGGKQLAEAADKYVCLCVYILLRKLYSANPHNTNKLFQLSDEDFDSLAQTLIAEPDRLLNFAKYADDIQDDRIEPTLKEVIALRDTIDYCEKIALEALGI